MNDEAFHEIQLNGKQLVFLFMAATVVSVVIFLCGVMVGRGVRTEASAVAGGSDAVDPGRPDEAATADAPPPAAAGVPPAEAPPDPDEGADSTHEQLTAADPGRQQRVAPAQPQPAPVEARADTPPPPAERPAERPAAERPAAERPAAERPVAEPASRPASVTGSGFVVQIAALRDRTEADAIVKRLAGKGYQAFVVNPLPGKPPVYKVQVGRFAERGAADRIAARLKSEEQFSPWVTR
jgi:cell division septation protein DedD